MVFTANALLVAVTVPRVSPAAVMLPVAVASDWLTTDGTTVPTVTVTVTVLPNGRSVPAAGFWRMTVPTAAVVLLPLTEAATKSAPVRAATAAACVRPTTCGTATLTAPPPAATFKVTPSANSSCSTFSSVSVPSEPGTSAATAGTCWTVTRRPPGMVTDVMA